MPTSLYEQAVEDILKAPPSTTTTASGAQILYPYPSPIEWRDVWIYFLLVDRFNNPNNPPVSGAPNYLLYQGGNFAGIRAQLPYLKELGVGAIWISPVLINPKWFKDFWGGYGMFDLLRIEPRYCTNEADARQHPEIADQEFRALVDEAHAQGIYVILDIVLNHVGNLFNYEGALDARDWRDQEYTIYWRDEGGQAQGNWTEIGSIPNVTAEMGIWPEEFQRNDYFRRKGKYKVNDNEVEGDFDSLKELVTEYLDTRKNIYPVRNLLIRAYQYLIAKFDLDGFRIDTLQYVEPEFARVFGNAMREYALSIGKKNFFTFGEVWQDDDEEKIAKFVGRDTHEGDELIGVDAAIDFPMRSRLVQVAKAKMPPSALAEHFDKRRNALKRIISSHGDAGNHYVTFLDNHDLTERFHYQPYIEQTALALTCLMTMQGIPCIYYGTEQGLDGRGDTREYVREALWGKRTFSRISELYIVIKNLTEQRRQQPTLRYGRQYFRMCSGDGIHFGYSQDKGGILAYSRLLNDREVLVVANTNPVRDTQPPIKDIHIIVDANLNPQGKVWKVLFSSLQAAQAAPQPGAVEIHGDFHIVQVHLRPMEAQILSW